MQIQDIMTIYEYNYWANGKIQSASARVSPEQFMAPTGYSYGSLRGTLVHLFEAERSWRMICQHNIFAFDLNEADFPTLEALMEQWHPEERAMREYLGSLGDEDMLSLVRYTTDTGIKRERILWHCLFHVVNHGMQHRSEAAAILTGYNQSPGELDFTLFLNERSS